MTYYPNETLLRNRKRWRIHQIDQLDEQKCTQKIGIMPGPTKKQLIERIDELNQQSSTGAKSPPGGDFMIYQI